MHEHDTNERQPYDPAAPVPKRREVVPLSTTDLTGGWVVVEAISGDGSTSFWLVDPERRRSGGGGWRPDMAPHENVGPLPREWTKRIGITCAGKTHSGKPCGNNVKTSGGLCSRHIEQGGES